MLCKYLESHTTESEIKRILHFLRVLLNNTNQKSSSFASTGKNIRSILDSSHILQFTVQKPRHSSQESIGILHRSLNRDNLTDPPLLQPIVSAESNPGAVNGVNCPGGNIVGRISDTNEGVHMNKNTLEPWFAM